MSIEFAEIVSIVGATAPADLTSATRAITDAIARVETEHPGYRHSNPNEIRCIARECSQYMDVPVGALATCAPRPWRMPRIVPRTSTPCSRTSRRCSSPAGPAGHRKPPGNLGFPGVFRVRLTALVQAAGSRQR
ncbi:hypothetical protein [Arthrobacter sp. PAMC25284]|uniref:hypothetical protein n=1 Tax=Arthrobacter sp. PAMC25284 TaxID=2861279 RepID=UPI001C63A18B|nr:hypothetical protein [Arthrobacter sp. PAMC25284]QYF90273.1 hypothetical protein KY499_02760 [Arthrobacter sp. PAMC25284]